MYQTETIIALGSNLGNAIFNLRCAVRELENIGNIKKFANIYISSPYGYKLQSNFYNTAIKLVTNQQPLELINNVKDYSSITKYLKTFIKESQSHTLEHLIIKTSTLLEKKFKIKNVKIIINKTSVAKKYGAESLSVSN